MAHYTVNIEADGDGVCMAHVVELPGCVVWAAESAVVVMEAVPQAIQAHLDWLAQHGEPGMAGAGPITVAVAEARAEGAPLRRGSRAALFVSDQAPLGQEEMETCFRQAGYRRADLLALVRGLPRRMLDWQPEPEGMTVRAILRHLGNSEEFYVSRLVDPATLPPQWAHDETLSLSPFLAMERRTVLARLRRLSDAARAAVVYPLHPSGHADEPWTARKAVRRLLEHEQEHLDHIRALLGDWREHLLARVAAERAALLFGVLGLDDVTLTTVPVADGWTIKDLLAHVAAWDELFADRIAQIVAGHMDTLVSVDLDAHNAAVADARRDWSLNQAVAAFTNERARCLAVLEQVPTEMFYRVMALPWGRAQIHTWTEWRASHDRRHAWEIERWRRRAKPARGITPRPLLLAAFAAARAELLATAALVPPGDRATRPLCNGWTLKDKLGHLADWDRLAVAVFQDLAAGRDPQVDPTVDPENGFDRWNAAHRAARQDQPWETVWADFLGAREALAAVLASLDDAALRRPFASPWNPNDAASKWVGIWLHHDREHAAEIRTGLRLPLPARLKHA